MATSAHSFNRTLDRATCYRGLAYGSDRHRAGSADYPGGHILHAAAGNMSDMTAAHEQYLPRQSDCALDNKIEINQLSSPSWSRYCSSVRVTGHALALLRHDVRRHRTEHHFERCCPGTSDQADLIGTMPSGPLPQSAEAPPPAPRAGRRSASRRSSRSWSVSGRSAPRVPSGRR